MAEDTLENEDEWIPIRLREDEEMDFFTELALHEAERWIQAVTRKKFEYDEDFRKSLGNGVLLCELLNCLKPGSVKRINKLPGAIAGLDNINVFLAACEKSFGLNNTQLFDPSDLEDLSTRAISDESEDFLKQEVDRRARNVAVTVYWLGKAVAGKYKGPELDASAFSALVHSHGNKNIISDDCFKNGSPLTKENTSLTESSNHKHYRDSSYDSLGSYERESESSFDELDSSGNLQARVDMREMRRYNSTNSLSMPRDLRLSTASGDDYKHDSMYVSSPDLSQGSHAHTRSSSTDSMEGSYYGNHSRQSSGSTDNYATRRLSSSTRKTSTSTPDPLQFVKLKGAAELAEQAKKQMEVAKEVSLMRGKVDSIGGSEEPDWQSNFNSWRSRRKSAHARVGEDLLDEETEKRPHKTFNQIMAEKEKRRSLGPMSFYPTEDEDQKIDKKEKRRSVGQMNFYPVDDDDSGIGVRSRESPISKSNSQKNESKPKGKTSKSTDVAPWAQDSSGEDNSQSDSETNNSHQSGDTDSVFSDKSTPSKVLSDDDSWVKNKPTAQTVSSKLAQPPKTQRSLGDSMKIWENNANESQKSNNKKIRDLPANSAKIKNITQAFEQKDKEANASPVITKRSEFNRSSLSKSLDLTDHSYSKPYTPSEQKPPSPLSPTAPKALIPRDQRFSRGSSSGESPAVNNANKPSVSDNVRYYQAISPSHILKPSALTPGGSTTVSPKPPVTSPKPSRAKIAAVKAKFESGSNMADVLDIVPTQNRNVKDGNINKYSDNVEEVNPGATADDLKDKTESKKMTCKLEGMEKENAELIENERSEQNNINEHYLRGHVRTVRENLYDIQEDMTEDKYHNEDSTKMNSPMKQNQEYADICVASDQDKIKTDTGTFNRFSEDLNQSEHSEDIESKEARDVDVFAQQVVDYVLKKVKNQDINIQNLDIPKLDFGLLHDKENDYVLPDKENSKELDQTQENEVLREFCIIKGNTEMLRSPSPGSTSSLSPPASPVFRRSSRPVAVLNLDSSRTLDPPVTSELPKQENIAVTTYSPRDSRVPPNPELHTKQGMADKEDLSRFSDTQTLSESPGQQAVTMDTDSPQISGQSFGSDSPRPPALPTSSIPDIIVSNITDCAYEGVTHNVSNPTDLGLLHSGYMLSDYGVLPDGVEKFTEQTIKINQKPNNNRGFGFFLVGGSEKKQPLTVQRVSLGSETSENDDVFLDDANSSAADVCEVEANDELISINGRDVTSLTLAQVQGIVDHSVKRGQIELRIKRYLQEDGYDSMEDNAFNDKASMSNKLDVQTDSSEDTVTYRPALQISTKTEEKPRLMDQLIEERKRETNNNEKHLRAPSPEVTESYQTEITVSTQAAPVYQPIQMNEPIRSQNTSAPDRAWDTSAPDRARERSAPDRAQDMSAPDGAWDKSGPDRAQDMSAPDDVTLTEERSTISVKKSPGSTNLQSDHAPVEMRRSQPPVVQHSTQPPAPPKTELPPLAKHTESPGVTAADDSSGFGPPAALLRWQRPRPKSEYQSSFSSNDNQPSDRTKRFSATLPYKSEHTFTIDKDYSKDDSMMEKVSKDFKESVSVSKPVESKPDTYHFNDSSRIEDWQQKQEQKRKPEQHSSTPPVEFNIHREEHLTAQSAAPARKQAQIDAPNLMEINIPNINEATTTLSPQEKFERDQQRIRMQYEEEKRRAREAEKQKQEQEQQALNSDKFLKNMEAQIIQTKQEAASHNLIDKEPIRSPVTEPRFTSNPVTIKLPSGSQGRQLVIDPRNLEDKSDSILPEYSFKVDLPKTESGPPLRTFNQPEQSPDEILAKEREKIREEEKRKFEEEQQRWKEEKERELREEKESIERERERLQREQEKVEREKALLEQKARQEESLRYQPVSNHVHPSPRSSAGSAGSSLSQSPRSPPPALDAKYRETQSKKVPPPATAPKPERGSAKARLTREDLLAMNRKATPLVRPDTTLETSGEKLDNSLSPTTREPPSKGELHSLNAVPKPKFHNSAAWIKDKDIENHTQNEKPFVIGKRSDMIHQRDYSNPSDHWLVREAEKRRLAEKSDYANIESVTAHAGPTKPSQSSLVSRFRGDIEPPPRSNRYSYPSSYSSDSGLSSTTRPQSSTASSLNQYNRVPEKTVTQFSAKTQPNTYSSNPSLSQTLPQNFSFNANVRNQDGMPTKPPRSLTDDSGPVIAVSGKQKCSHCGEELGFGAAMVIESLGLYYHVQCFRCCVCHTPLGNGSEGTDVRVRVNKLHCKNCYSNDEAGLKFSKV